MKIHIGRITDITERDIDFYIEYETQNPHRRVGFGVRKHEVSNLALVANAEGKPIEVTMNNNRRIIAVKIEGTIVVQRNVKPARARKRNFLHDLRVNLFGLTGSRA